MLQEFVIAVLGAVKIRDWCLVLFSRQICHLASLHVHYANELIRVGDQEVTCERLVLTDLVRVVDWLA